MIYETIKIGDGEIRVLVTDQLPEGVDVMLVGQPDLDDEDPLDSMARRSVVLRSGDQP